MSGRCLIPGGELGVERVRGLFLKAVALECVLLAAETIEVLLRVVLLVAVRSFALLIIVELVVFPCPKTLITPEPSLIITKVRMGPSGACRRLGQSRVIFRR